MNNNNYSDCHLHRRISKESLGLIFFLLIMLLALGSNKAAAVPLPTDLIISTSLSTNPNAGDHLSFDEDDSNPAIGNAAHTGSLVQTIGGVDSTTTINDTTITSGINPLSGALTDIGDGWEIHSAINGSFLGSSAESKDIYDLFFSLKNQSATDSIQVTVTLDFNNHVDSTGGDGFSASEIQLFD